MDFLVDYGHSDSDENDEAVENHKNETSPDNDKPEHDNSSVLADETAGLASGKPQPDDVHSKQNTISENPIPKPINYLGLDSSSSEDESILSSKTTEISDDGHKKGTDMPESAFWKGYSKDDFSQPPHMTWNVDCEGPSVYQSVNKDERKVGCGFQYRSKCPNKDKGNSDILDNDGSHNATKKMKRSCFFVHHKIAPKLSNRHTLSKVPNSNILDLHGHTGVVNRIKWCKQEFSHLLLSVSMDRTVRLWNVFSTANYEVQTFCFHTKAVRDAVWSPSGRQFVSCGYDRTARLCDVEKGSQLQEYDHPGFATCTQYHPVDHNVFMTGTREAIYCWDHRTEPTPVKIYNYKDKIGQVQDILFSSDGSQFFTCCDVVSRDSADRNIMVWDYRSSVVLSNQVYQERYTCTRLRLHPNGKQFLAQSNGDYIALFSTDRPYKMHKGKRFSEHKVFGYNIGCDFSPQGNLVASGSSDGRLYIYDHRTSRLIVKLGSGDGVCMDVAWHPVLNSTVATSTWGGTVSVWQ